MNRHERRASVSSIRHSNLLTHLIASDVPLDDHAVLHNAVLQSHLDPRASAAWARWPVLGPATMKPVHTIEMTHAAPIDGRGQRSPADVLARAIRDHLLRTAADRFCVGMKDRPAAEFLRTKLARYRASAWQRDRSEVQCPDRHRGTVTELLWTILMIRDAIPGDRTIRAALALDPFSIAQPSDHDPPRSSSKAEEEHHGQ
jgi:hypothetical protein